METIKKLFQKYKEIILYIFFGAATTVVSIVVYALAQLPMQDIIHDETVVSLFGRWDIQRMYLGIFAAKVISWIAAVTFAFVTNKLWVFESKSWKPSVALREFWLFVFARLATGPIEWLGVPLLVSLGLNQTLFNVEGFFANIICMVLVVVLNYVFSKLIIFRKKKDKAA
jgi:putative flippase GtrA